MKTNLFEFMGFFKDPLDDAIEKTDKIYYPILEKLEKSNKRNIKYNSSKYLKSIIDFYELHKIVLGTMIIFSDKTLFTKAMSHVERIDFDGLRILITKSSADNVRLKKIFKNRLNTINSLKVGYSQKDTLIEILKLNNAVHGSSVSADIYDSFINSSIVTIFSISDGIEDLSVFS